MYVTLYSKSLYVSATRFSVIFIPILFTSLFSVFFNKMAAVDTGTSVYVPPLCLFCSYHPPLCIIQSIHHPLYIHISTPHGPGWHQRLERRDCHFGVAEIRRKSRPPTHLHSHPICPPLTSSHPGAVHCQILLSVVGTQWRISQCVHACVRASILFQHTNICQTNCTCGTVRQVLENF